MKNAKQDKLVKKMIMHYEPSNVWEYQQGKASNIGTSYLEQKEEEGKQYEQMNYEKLNKYIDWLMLSDQTMRKEIHKMKRIIQEMNDAMEKNNDTLQKIKEKFKKQSEEIDWLYKKVSKQKEKLKKEQLQTKKLKKFVRYIGFGLQINSLSDNLDKMLKKCSYKVETYTIPERFRRNALDYKNERN